MDIKKYAGKIRFSDASIHIQANTDHIPRGYSEQRTEFEKSFKHDVFKRVVQQLNRLGWTCKIPEEYIKQYGMSFARSYRECQKGDLYGKLEFHTYSISFEMWQDVNVPHEQRNDGKGQYLHDKEKYMPYLLLLEMKRTRNRLAAYFGNVCSFTFDDAWMHSQKKIGPGGPTALEKIQQDYKDCWHYKPELGHRGGIEYECNSMSAEKQRLQHGMPVWFYDWKGRLNKGTAYYNINNMWWVVSGKYGRRNIYCGELYINLPGDPHIKSNAQLREKGLKQKLADAVNAQNFEQAIVLRDQINQDKLEKVA